MFYFLQTARHENYKHYQIYAEGRSQDRLPTHVYVRIQRPEHYVLDRITRDDTVFGKLGLQFQPLSSVQ